VVCRQCGRSNPDGANFCANCGAYLGWDGAPAPTPAQKPSTQRGAPAPEQHVAAVLRLADATLAVEPGSGVEVTATVHNEGSQVEEFTVTVAGPADRWATVEPAALRIYPGEHAECVVRFEPPRSPEALGGRAPFSVRAASTVHRGLVASADGVLEIKPFRALSAALLPEQTSGTGRTVHQVEVTNAGNVTEPLQVLVHAEGEDRRLSFDGPGAEFAAVPGRSVFALGVRPRFRLVGGVRLHPFHVVLTPRPPVAPVRLDGRMRARALVPLWLAIVLVALVLVFCACALSNLSG
jgi:zinc ribbon protein